MKKLILFLPVLIFISCATNIRVADVPQFAYSEGDFNYSSPEDIKITLRPDGAKWITDTGISLPMGAELETILEALYPDADSFKYGKVVKQQNLLSVPLPLPIPIILKNETVLSVRALQLGTHK